SVTLVCTLASLLLKSKRRRTPRITSTITSIETASSATVKPRSPRAARTDGGRCVVVMERASRRASVGPDHAHRDALAVAQDAARLAAGEIHLDHLELDVGVRRGAVLRLGRGVEVAVLQGVDAVLGDRRRPRPGDDDAAGGCRADVPTLGGVVDLVHRARRVPLVG